MDKSWLYKSRIVKADIPKENKDDLRKRLGIEVTAYINSGGQIQHCTPFAYSVKEEASPRQKKAIETFTFAVGNKL